MYEDIIYTNKEFHMINKGYICDTLRIALFNVNVVDNKFFSINSLEFHFDMNNELQAISLYIDFKKCKKKNLVPLQLTPAQFFDKENNFFFWNTIYRFLPCPKHFEEWIINNSERAINPLIKKANNNLLPSLKTYFGF